jgi:hypothetical protein
MRARSGAATVAVIALLVAVARCSSGNGFCSDDAHDIVASSETACAIEGDVYARTGSIDVLLEGKSCDDACGAGRFCTLPTAYVSAFGAAQGDGGVGDAIAVEGGLSYRCPSFPQTLQVGCSAICE